MARLRTTVWVALALVALAMTLVVPRIATAAEDAGVDPSARAVAILEQAERADAAFQLQAALAGYEEALRLDPAMARAMRAQQRSAALRARAEGAFAPLAALERVRRDPVLASDPRAIDELVREAEGFPEGLVRVEAWVLAAEAYANRLGRVEEAMPLWRRIATDPRSTHGVASAAARALASHHLARGDYDGAMATLALPATDAKLSADVRRAVRRHKLHIASIAAIAAASVLAVGAILRAARKKQLRVVALRARASSRLVLAYCAYVAVAGGALASGYEDGTARPFLLLGALLVPLLLVARAWGAAGSPSRRARFARATLCATSALGLAFLVLEHVDVGYLEDLGL